MTTLIRREAAPTEATLEHGLQTILTRSKVLNRSYGQFRSFVLKMPKTLITLLVAGFSAVASVALILGAWEALTNGVVQLLLGHPNLVAGSLILILSLTPLLATFRRGDGETSTLARALNGAFGLCLVVCGFWLFNL